MVNTGFLQSRRYGFEMVDGPSTPLPRINQKFTPNQTARIFREFFAI
jgi:hypothetical protein